MLNRSYLWIYVLSILLLPAGCSEKTDMWRGRIEVISGVRMITSERPILHAPDSLVQIIFTKDLVIVGDTGDSAQAFGPAFGVTTDNQGNIYIANTEMARILKFDKNGTFLRSIGSAGIGPTQFKEPVDMAVDQEDNLYVVDAVMDRVTKFNSQLEFVDIFQTHVRQPRRIRVDAEGHILVFAITQHDLIYKYDQNGVLVSSFYDPQESFRIMGNLKQLIDYSDAGMEVSNDGYVYVSSRHPYRIRKYDRVDGLALEFSRETPFELKPFDDWAGNEAPPPVGTSGALAVLPDGRVMNVVQYQTFGKEENVAHWKQGLKIESIERWIDVFTTDGRWQMTSKITAPGFPAHVDRQGYIYFIELNPSRIVRYAVTLPGG